MSPVTISTDHPLRSVWTKIDGVKVHSRISAHDFAAGGIPIVFVHGLGASTRYMEPTMALLAREHPVAGLDLPGFGRSGSPQHHQDLPALAHTLTRWLDAHGIPAALFVGNSFGCQIIVECVVDEPHRTVGIVLNAPTMDPAHRTWYGQILRVIVDIPREPISLAWLVARDYLRAGPVRLLRTLLTALADPIEEKLPRIAVPATVVCGGRDPLVTTEWGDQVARLIGGATAGAPGANLVVVPHAAHALPYDDPASLAAAIAELLHRVKTQR
jgi:Lysophospholipase